MRKLILSISVLCLSLLTANAQTMKNERNFQISFISPFGTNGTLSHQITNRYSLNILGGYSAGNRVLELGSLYNVNTNYTTGVQAAGIVNYTGKSDEAVQFAGVVNLAEKGESSFQAAGVANVTDNVEGVQLAGVTNSAKDVEGAQVAGVANKAKKVEGAQIAGVVNIADKVDGVQIGLINIANRYEEGVPIGLINIVKKGGKQEFEVSFSEAINTAINFKLGTDKLYTIFSAGVNYIKKPVNYAVGVGFGTHIDWKRGWGNQIEGIGYMLTEEGKFINELNMLTQLKFTVSKEIAKHFKVFAGPVLNMTISDYKNPSTGKLGSSLNPYTIWENNGKRTNLNAWAGISAGIRF